MNFPAILGCLITACLAIALPLGWVMNIFKLCANHEVINPLFILRIAGILLAPLGAVLGYY